MQFAGRRQLMFPSRGERKPCKHWKHRPAAGGLDVPQRCACVLDAHSHHAQRCCKFLRTRRRNAVHDLFQRFATEASYTALAE
eukprot:4765165-Amphidinium_carterae.1